MGNITFTMKKPVELPDPDGRYIGDNIISTSNWPDEAGNVNLTQTGGTRWIKSDENPPNGHQYMRFDQNAYIRGVSPQFGAECSFYGVIRQTRPQDSKINGRWFYLGNRNAGDGNFYCVDNNAGAGTAYFLRPGGAIANVWNNYYDTGQWLIISARFSTTPWYNHQGTLYRGVAYRNDVLLNVGNDSSGYSMAPGTNYVMLGSDYEGNAYFDIADFMYFNRVLTEDEHNLLINTLMSRYAIPTWSP